MGLCICSRQGIRLLYNIAAGNGKSYLDLRSADQGADEVRA